MRLRCQPSGNQFQRKVVLKCWEQKKGQKPFSNALCPLPAHAYPSPCRFPGCFPVNPARLLFHDRSETTSRLLPPLRVSHQTLPTYHPQESRNKRKRACRLRMKVADTAPPVKKKAGDNSSPLPPLRHHRHQRRERQSRAAL